MRSSSCSERGVRHFLEEALLAAVDPSLLIHFWHTRRASALGAMLETRTVLATSATSRQRNSLAVVTEARGSAEAAASERQEE